MTYHRVLRVFMQRPGLNLAIALSLALGISGSAAVLKLADSLFDRGAPAVKDPRSLAKLYFHDPKRGSFSTSSYANFRDYAAAIKVFESLAAEVTLPFTVSCNDTVSRLSVSLVSPNFFSVLRVELSRGRSFAGRDETVDVRSAVISDDLWRRAGASAMESLKIEVNGSRFGVIGVAAPGFHGASRKDGADVWIPAAAGPLIATGFMPANLLQDRELQWFDVVGRLRPDISFREAQAEVKGRSVWLERLDPKANQGKDLALGDWHDVAIGSDRMQLVRLTAMLGIAATLVLLIACANIANLLIGRNLARRPEIALRFALGASRLQVGRMLLGESLLLALVGGLLGSIFEAASGSLWASLGLPVSKLDFQLDARSALLTLAVSVAAGLLIGAIPAMLASRRELLHRTTAGTEARSRAWGGWLVVCEVALALASLALTALIVQSLRNELTSGFGYNPGKLAVAQVDLESRRYSTERANSFYRDFLARIRSDHRVSAASMVRFLPFDDTSASWKVYLPDHPDDKDLAGIAVNLVGSDFFRTMELPIVEGQDLLTGDGANTGAVVSESFAHRFWPNRSAVGQRLSLISASGPFLEVVGVAKDAKWSGLQEPPGPYVYLSNVTGARFDPLADFATGMQLVVRSQGDPHRVLADLRRTAVAMDRSLPITRLTTLADYIANTAEGERDRVLLMTSLAAICSVLSAVGIYAVLTQILAARARELAIRLALGASPPDLWRSVLLRGIVQILAGVLLGLVLTWTLGRLIQSQLYNIGARDLLTLSGSALAVLGLGLTISLVQGRKVVRVASSALMAEIRRQ
jgi:putative ABC transport system permease protein